MVAFVRGSIRPAVLDDAVRPPEPLFLGQNDHEVTLDLYRVGMFCQAPCERQSTHMGVHRDTLYDSIHIAQHHIGGLACHTGDSQHLGHRARQPPMPATLHHFRRGENVLRLIVVETRAPDVALERRALRAYVVIQCAVFLEQLRGHLVHLLISALRRQLDGNHAFPGRTVVERDACARKNSFEDAVDGSCPIFDIIFHLFYK